MSDNQRPGNWQPNTQGPQGPGAPQGIFQQYGPPPQFAAPRGGQPPYGQSGQAQHGQGQYGQPQYGQPQHSQPPYGSQTQAPARRKSRTPAIIAAVVALALVVGGGFLAFSLLSGSTPAATKGLPGDALAVLELNLNPAATDKLAVKEFAEKFPGLAGDVSEVGDDYKAALFNLIPASDDKPDYETEVKPWLGDSVAVAAVGDPVEPDMVASVQVTDAEAAEAFATEHLDGSLVEFIDDLMIISEESAPADVVAIRENPVADNEAYRADMATLGAGYLATGWMSQEFISAQVTSTEQESGIAVGDVTAHGAAGVKVEDGAAVLRAVSWTNQEFTAAEVETDFASSLPAAGLGAFSLAFSDETVDLIWEQLADLRSQTPEVLTQFGVETSDDLHAVLGNQLAVTVDFADDMPQIGMKVDTDDPARHQEAMTALAESAGLPLEHLTDGTTVYTTLGMSPDELADPAGELGDNDVFTKLTAGSGDAQGIIWLDVPALVANEALGLSSDPTVAENLAPLSGLGVSTSVIGDGYSETFVRVGTK